MKKCILNMLLLLLSFCLVCCKENTEKKEKEFLTQGVEQLKLGEQYDWIIVLPGVGCHGCIQEGEFFMKQHVSNKKILFVLTNISSLKILQQKTGVKIGAYTNIYVDRDNLFKLPTDNAIYPCVIQLENGKLFQYMFQSPKTAAFHQIEKHL